MNRLFRMVVLIPSLLSGLLLQTACSDEAAEVAVETLQAVPAPAEAPDSVTPVVMDDVISRVGDQKITFGEINVMLNSSAVVGLSIPALGTPERDTVRIVLLDKLISANLIYLDALRKGVDQEPEYQQAIRRFTQGMLAELHQENLLGDVSVSDEEIETFYNESVEPGTELTSDARLQIGSVLRKQKIEQRRAERREQLREGIEVTVYQKNFETAGDDERADDVVVAEAGREEITWGETRGILVAAGIAAVHRDPLAMELDARLTALQREIDTRIMAQKARAAGHNEDPVYRARLAEYRKNRLINIHRTNLARGMAPTDEDLEAFFEANQQRITVPEFRRVQMVVLKTEEEAQDIKRRIEAGEMTMYEAAQRHSISPDAKKDLGEIGWVQQGRLLVPELEVEVFTLGPGEIGGPVQVGKEWHIMRVMDVREAQRANLSEAATSKEARRLYIHDRLDEYTANLRKNDFTVEVYEDKIVLLAQAEADMVAQLAEQAGEPGSITQERLKELQKYITPPQRPE
ncbi:MAG: peptidylprolyl isomerase [Gammaproteobacteria bacterium]